MCLHVFPMCEHAEWVSVERLAWSLVSIEGGGQPRWMLKPHQGRVAISVREGGKIQESQAAGHLTTPTRSTSRHVVGVGVSVGGAFADFSPRCCGEQKGGLLHSAYLGRDLARCHEFPTGSGCRGRGAPLSLAFRVTSLGSGSLPLTSDGLSWSRASWTNRFANEHDPHPPCAAFSP